MLVAVIPVIAKADTFTAQEMEAFRQELLQVRYFSYVYCGVL
jgi:septin family protein